MNNTTFFKAEFFIRNRREFRKKLGSLGLSVIASNGLLQKSLDATFPFRQDSNFWYLTGLNEPSILLVIDGDDEYLVLPEQSEYMRIFDGGMDKESIGKSSGIGEVFDFQEGWNKLQKRLKKVKKVGVLLAPAPYIQQLNMYVNPTKAQLQKQLLESNPKLEFKDIKPLTIGLRSIKQPEELSAIKKATNITMQGFVDASKAFKSVKSEKELERVLSEQFLRADAEHAYSPIVASGKNATILHYVINDSNLTEKQLTLIDSGASIDMYSSDITRTLAKSPTERQRKVHESVQNVLSLATEEIKPGITLRDFEKRVKEIMSERLIELGLLNSIDDDRYREYYPHATSHHVGLDVHDPIPSDEVLRPGMVLTVEPGIYIKKESVGVRIEDIVLVNKSGCENLSTKLSRGYDLLTIDQ